MARVPIQVVILSWGGSLHDNSEVYLVISGNTTLFVENDFKVGSSATGQFFHVTQNNGVVSINSKLSLNHDEAHYALSGGPITSFRNG